MASIRPIKGGGWRVFVAIQGVRDSRVFKEEEGRKAAKDWGAAREAAIRADAKRAAIKTGHTVYDAIVEFQKRKLHTRKSEEWEAQRLHFLIESLSFTAVLLRKLDHDDIREWVDERAAVVAGSTINRDLNLLSTVFAFAVERQWVESNPLHKFARPDNPEPRNARISAKDAKTITDALGYEDGATPAGKAERVAVAFLLALETGMRKGELLKVTPEYCFENYIRLPAAITKNGYARNVPLSPKAKELVGLLFAGNDGGPLVGLKSGDFDRIWRKARDKTPLTGLHFHDTRHEAVTRLARLLGIMELASMIGHRDLKSLQIYFNPTPDEIAAKLRD